MATKLNGAPAHRWWRELLTRPNGHAPESAGAFRRLALQLHYEQADAQSPRSVLVVAADEKAQPALAAMELAAALAKQLQRPVLLIDACPAAPDLSRMLGCEGKSGFQNLMAGGDATVTALALPTTQPGVAFLPAGTEVLALQPELSQRGAEFLRDVSAAFEFAVVYGGIVPHSAAGAALALAAAVGRTLLVVTENETRTEDLDAAQETLRICNARRMGLLLGTVPLT